MANLRVTNYSAMLPRDRPKFDAPAIRRWRRRLLSWYDRNRRDLPWRQDRDPYRVWLSEIMLQQTRVSAVLEHYRRFLRRFPTVQKLASAREPAVLAAWSGLGYYRRARMMHAAAKAIVKQHGGKISRRHCGAARAARHRPLYGGGHRQHCVRCARGRGGRKRGTRAGARLRKLV